YWARARENSILGDSHAWAYVPLLRSYALETGGKNVVPTIPAVFSEDRKEPSVGTAPGTGNACGSAKLKPQTSNVIEVAAPSWNHIGRILTSPLKVGATGTPGTGRAFLLPIRQQSFSLKRRCFFKSKL